MHGRSLVDRGHRLCMCAHRTERKHGSGSSSRLHPVRRRPRRGSRGRRQRARIVCAGRGAVLAVHSPEIRSQ